MPDAVAAVTANSPVSRLRGRTVLVVDAAAPRSRDCTLYLLQQGASVLLLGARAHALQRLRAELLEAVPSARVEYCIGDARQPEQLRQAMLHAYGMQRRLDLLLLDGKARTRGGRIVALCPRSVQ